jgi:predicted RecA/RadA family phage recombinase
MTTGTTAYRDLELGNVTTRKAGAAITAGMVVKLDTTEGQVVKCTAITDKVFGVALNTVASGELVEVQRRGVAKVICGAAIALGAEVMPDSGVAGSVITAAGATAISCGVAESQSDTLGQLVRVDLVRMLRSPLNP